VVVVVVNGLIGPSAAAETAGRSACIREQRKQAWELYFLLIPLSLKLLAHITLSNALFSPCLKITCPPSCTVLYLALTMPEQTDGNRRFLHGGIRRYARCESYFIPFIYSIPTNRVIMTFYLLLMLYYTILTILIVREDILMFVAESVKSKSFHFAP
jgi:hypothetical protein